MKKALIYKFSQNPDMLKKLIQTGSDKLVEYSMKDPYWGGMLENSKNRLGALLMELRDNYLKTNKVYIEGSGLDTLDISIDK